MLDEIFLLLQGAAVPLGRQIDVALVEHAEHAAQAFKALALIGNLELHSVASAASCDSPAIERLLSPLPCIFHVAKLGSSQSGP
jgi:hypothetical protein